MAMRLKQPFACRYFADGLPVDGINPADFDEYELDGRQALMSQANLTIGIDLDCNLAVEPFILQTLINNWPGNCNRVHGR